MNDLRQLSAIEEIKQLKARYFRCLDTKAFDTLRTVFAEDAIFDVSDAMKDPILGTPPDALDLSPIEGLDAIIAGIEAVLAGAQSVHHGHTPEIELTSDRTATGIWPMEDIVRTAEFELHGYGHYHEEYERTQDGWRIRSLKLTRLRVMLAPAEG